MDERNSNGSVGDLPEDIQRWTAKRRAALILYRYLLTTNGSCVIAYLLLATDATPDQLARLAA